MTYETQMEISGNGSTDLLKSSMEGNKHLSLREPQNTNMHSCMSFSKQNVIKIYINNQNALKKQNETPGHIFTRIT